MDPAQLVRDARARAGLSQRELALRAGTSGPTVAAYESGRVEPRLSTLERLLAAAGQRMHIWTEPLGRPMTREERRSLYLHEAIAREVEAHPYEALRRARLNLATMRRADAGRRASHWLDAWDRLVRGGDVHVVVQVLTDPDDPDARELRQNTPFAGILSPPQRWDVYRRFREIDACDATSSST